MKKIFLPLLFLLFLTPLFSADIRLAAMKGNLPFSDPSLPGGGFSVQLVTEVFARSGYRALIHFRPLSRGIDEIKKGKWAGMLGLHHTEERAKSLLYSEPFLKTETLFYSLKEKGLPPAGEKLSNGKIIGVLNGSSSWEKLRNSGQRIFLVQSYEQGLTMLLAGRIDYLLGDGPSINYQIENEFKPEERMRISRALFPFQRRTFHLVFPKIHHDSAELQQIFNQGLMEVIEDGTYDRLLKFHHLK